MPFFFSSKIWETGQLVLYLRGGITGSLNLYQSMEFLNLWHPLALGSFLLAVSRSRGNDLIIINQSDVQNLVKTNEVPVNHNRESELA